ncbi:hypothetical protein KP509_03G067100 [Ceratopteris richardii]|uniref:Chlorophyllase n=1 Tax=Ceratopteris richardii TaxID=49495 RepID=A0A8T2V0M8_CERRI|nr:hypothetical protein KP509_03G067100 [Ceratopteris richardii]
MAPSHPLALSCLWFHLGILLLLIYVLLCWEITTASAHTQQNKAIHHHESLVFPQLDNGLPATKPLEIGSANLEVLVFQTSRSISCLLTKVAQLPDSLQPPARTVVAAPAVTGTYPVILFKHGFAIQNCYYTDMFTLLASSGYIIVAPQHTTLDSDCTAEIEETRNVAIWIHGSLQEVLLNAMPKVKVTPNTSSLIMAGHSRWGKVAFAMALGKGSSDANDDVNFSALVALDPVDGFSLSTSSVPQMVKADCTHNLNRLLIPALILGTGYGEKGLVPCAPSCCMLQSSGILQLLFLAAHVSPFCCRVWTYGLPRSNNNDHGRSL